MEREEFKTLAKAMRVAYTNASFMPDQDSFEVWFMMLKDIPYRVATAAVQKYISEQHYPPAISDIRDEAAKIMSSEKDELTEMDAWSKVRKAISNGVYGAEKEFERLPEPIQAAIGSASFLRDCAMDESFNESVVQSNFMRSYRSVLERNRSKNKLSASLQNEINMLRLEKTEEKMELLVEKGVV